MSNKSHHTEPVPPQLGPVVDELAALLLDAVEGHLTMNRRGLTRKPLLVRTISVRIQESTQQIRAVAYVRLTRKPLLVRRACQPVS